MNGGPFAAALDRVTRVPHVQGALVVEVQDGLVVAESVMEGVRGDAAAALASSLAGRLTKVTDATGVGDPRFLYLMAERGGLLMVPAGSGLVVVAIASPEVNIGLARLEMLRAAERVE